MNDFTASNGLPVIPDGSGGFQFVERYQMGTLTGISEGGALALREFFRAEEDERLGRWRSTENPSWVAVGDDSGRILFRHDDGLRGFSVDSVTKDASRWATELRSVAREYFAAHPETKPWCNAKDGEIWALTIDGKEDAYVIVNTDTDGFRFFPARSTVFRPGAFPSEVTAGRRIYPTEDS